MKRLMISFLGPFEARLDDENIASAFRTKKERALLVYLISEANRQHHRDILGELFWPERPEGYARTNLRQALSGIRRSLPNFENPEPFLLISDEFIQFNPRSPHFLDTVEFDRLIAFTQEHKHQSVETCETCAEKLEAAIRLYRGDFLEDFLIPDANTFQEWVMFQREHFFRYLLAALQHLIEFYKQKGEFKTAQQYAWRQVTLASLEESAHRQLMVLLAMDGRRSAALEQYQTCRQILATELGVDPDIETTALYEKIKAGYTLTPIRPTIELPETNLPMQFTVFIGREDELAWLEDCLNNPLCRLVSITGMSGIGKTRLAIQTGRQILHYYPDGVWFVPLQAIHTKELIAPSIVQAIGLEQAGDAPKLRLMEYLAPRKALLILDNFEQLLDGTEILLELLRNAPGIKIIVTSQQRLSYQATCNLELRGLPVPTSHTNLMQAKEYAAVELFLARANRVYSGFELQDGDIGAIIDICRTVDGLPLGIELAAAGLRHRNPQQIATELQQNLDSLNTTLLDIPERHRSLRAAFDQSWILLNDRERDAYRRLSIFQSEFSLETAAQTTGANLAIISALVDKSLVQATAAGQYLIQPLLRQYASDKLADHFQKNDGETELPQIKATRPTHDLVTGLPNSLLFHDLCEYALARGRRNRKYVVLLELNINQTQAWRQALKSDHRDTFLVDLTAQLSDAIRESDTLARLGLTRFAILLEDVSQTSAADVVINKLLRGLEAKEIFGPDDLTERLIIGRGIFPDQADTVDALLRSAETRQNEAQKGGEDHA